jgi:hypothetical protein
VAFTLALRPKVIASGDGITVVNPYRTHFVPWRLVTFVDTGEWVQVHYTRPGPGDADPGGTGLGNTGLGSTVHCWALYVSARARRKIASGPPRPRGQRGLLGLGRGLAWGAGGGLGATPSSRLPEEARYLASLPPAKAMAVRLDSRADRERARAANAAADSSKELPRVTATWSWLALAAVVVPALILLAVALA